MASTAIRDYSFCRMASASTQTDSLTRAQLRAVEARGNVLVMAGAGTGKTKTLIERCLHCLEHDGVTMDQLLIVTFTEAAAAELRERLRRAIEAKATAVGNAATPGARERPASLETGEPKLGEPSAVSGACAAGPEIISWPEQLARFDLAHIGTLHSFCLKLVCEHFYELGLDPRLTLLDEGQARQLANETLDDQFTAYYAGEDKFSLAVRDLIQGHGGGRDDALRNLVLQLHHYSQTRPDAAGWLAAQREKFAADKPTDWQRWLPEALENWRHEWLPVLSSLASPPANEKAAELAAILSRLPCQPPGAGELPAPIPSSPGPTVVPSWRQAAAEALAQVVAADKVWPNRRKMVLREPLEALFAQGLFLHSLAGAQPGHDPLVEDWSWVRGPMATLLRLAEEFAAQLAERKRANGVLDFHDLEQFALQLLWNFSTGQPTAVAAGWRKRLRLIFVDEYQDINAAQDKIIQGLSREGAGANRFLVGDVKQSIYRFRLADPGIFRAYARDWRGDGGQTIALRENFRSRAGLLHLVNSLFHLLMREEAGGVAYDAEAELKAGSLETCGRDAAAASAPQAELLLRYKRGRSEAGDDETDELAGLDDTQREARLVAWRLQQFVAGGHAIFDEQRKAFRPVQWRDIAILLRSPRGRSEVFAKEFEQAGIPLAVARGGFYQSVEILDLLSLLQLLDNPLQDVPCLAVLRSPLVGLSLDELAEIRLAAKDKHFWTALVGSQRPADGGRKPEGKIAVFLERYSRWRRLARLVSLSQCLEAMLAETLYTDWLRAQPRGVQRAANVAAFLQLAQQFDQFQRQGLFRFLKFIEAQQEAEAEPEVPGVATEDAVRLLSIHQSKGLEFPVVVLADLAKPFNERDLRGEIIFDEHFGLCPKVKPPHLDRYYPSLPHWLAQRRQKLELRGEELRLLYVALTRARDHLILAASITPKSWGDKWTQPQPVTPQRIAAARCFADWVALWFSNQAQVPDRGQRTEEEGRRTESPAAGAPRPGASAGAVEELAWRIVADATVDGDMVGAERGRPASSPPATGLSSFVVPSATSAPGEEWGKLRARLEWNYPFKAATQRKAKSSVTALRREAEESDEEAESLFPNPAAGPLPRRRRVGGSKLSAAEIGIAHHKFLQHFALENADALASEAERLVREHYLSPEEQGVLDLTALAAFWNSAPGCKIRAQAGDVRRELPFTARFSPGELVTLAGVHAEAGLEAEYVLVQGVADLVVLRPGEIWLVDFKTDEVAAEGLPERVRIYSPQVRLYAAALERIFGRKVTQRALHFLATGQTVEV